MASFMPSSFTHMEIIGGTKVFVSGQPVRVHHVAREMAEAMTLKRNDEAVMITNLDAVYARFALWTRELSMIEPFYAVKCNSDEIILRTLAALGAGFDCASKSEIETVTRMGVSPYRIIYANPSKSSAFIEHADAKGVRMMTFDSAEELEKIVMHHENPQLLIRIAATDATATYPQAGKFGADPVTVSPDLLAYAVRLGVSIVGVSFHVGSGCNDPSAFREALMHARHLVDFGRRLGHSMEIVDIGGGFPGADHHPSFEKMALVIRSAIDEYFPDNDVRLIAEPGRFFAESPCTLIVNVIARKAVVARNNGGETPHMHYYINDGVYGSFNCAVYDHVPKCGRPLINRPGERFLSTVWGPTCDSIDRVEDMGAYTSAASSTFNGFARPTPLYVVSDHAWKCLGLECNNNKRKIEEGKTEEED